jgi:hypothetical protein
MGQKKRKGNVRPAKAVAEVRVPKPVTEVVTEKRYITTEPEVEIRKAGTLAQALTEPATFVVKPKRKVRRVIRREARRAA